MLLHVSLRLLTLANSLPDLNRVYFKPLREKEGMSVFTLLRG